LAGWANEFAFAHIDRIVLILSVFLGVSRLAPLSAHQSDDNHVSDVIRLQMP
jgi:hypothetical protein